MIKAKGDESRIELIDDKIATLDVFIGDLKRGDPIWKLINSIETLFSDNDAMQVLTLGTVHKSKGLEWERVFVMDADKYMPSKWAKKDWQIAQEDNLCYVAATRSMGELYYISSDFLKEARPKVEAPRLKAEDAKGGLLTEDFIDDLPKDDIPF